MTWEKILAKAKKVGKFTTAQKKAARSWPKCAIGEMVFQEELIENNDEFVLEARYPKLNRLGLEFSNAVDGDDVKEASRVYTEIVRVRDEVFDL